MNTFWKNGIAGGWAVLMLQPRAADRFSASRREAIRSFWTYAVILPWWFFSGFFGNQPYFAHYGVEPGFYMLCQFLGSVVSLGIGMGLLWVFARSEELTDGFWRFITGANWLQLVLVVLFAIPMFVLVRYRLLSHHDIQVLSTGLYIVSLVAQWLLAWRAFRCNPFLAAGLSILMPMAGSVVSDMINLRFFGSASPFEEPWFVQLYNSGLAY